VTLASQYHFTCSAWLTKIKMLCFITGLRYLHQK